MKTHKNIGIFTEFFVDTNKLISSFFYNQTALIHEAKFYGIAPLAKQLSMCKDVGKSNCGNILFCGKLDPPKSNHQAVKLIKAHYSTIVVAYDDHFACYQHKGIGKMN